MKPSIWPIVLSPLADLDLPPHRPLGQELEDRLAAVVLMLPVDGHRIFLYQALT
jgi:hypothetical protein